MFTGLIEDVGTIVSLKKRGRGTSFTISHSPVLDDLKLGDSIAVDGVCLTVTELDSQRFSVEASAETVGRSTLASKGLHGKVNLERALRLGDRLGGHLVTGHVDGVGKITSVIQEGETRLITFTVNNEISRYIVEKGSVTVDGISLTVNRVEDGSFSVTIIPYTGSHTALTAKRVGEEVNIETDIIGKYVEKLVAGKPEGKINLQFLSEHGFL